MVGWSVRVHGELHKALPAKDDRMSKLHQRRVTDSSGGDWGSYQLTAPLVCICYDVEEPLTPSHLLVRRRILSLPDYLGHICEPSNEDFEVSASQLTKRMKHLASVLNHFWRRWRSEYLSELRESHHHGAKNARNTHIAGYCTRWFPTMRTMEIRTDPGSDPWSRWSTSRCPSTSC